MYAVVQTGGKQYRVTPGEYVIVERLPGENGDNVQLNDILLIDNDGKITVGQPFVKGASVIATIVNQNRADKIIVFKKKRRQGYRRKNGHRQLQSVLHISEIKGDGASVKAENKPKVTAVAPLAMSPEKAIKIAGKLVLKEAYKADKKVRYELALEAKAARAPRAAKAAAAPKEAKPVAEKAPKAAAPKAAAKPAAEKAPKVAAPKAAKPAAAKKPAAKKTTDK
jgi:large subunit ribosomal protein L21